MLEVVVDLIRSPESIKATIDEVAENLGGIDILANNAGVSAEWTDADVTPEQ